MTMRKPVKTYSLHLLHELNCGLEELLRNSGDPSFDLEGWKGLVKDPISASLSAEDPVRILQKNINSLIDFFKTRTSDIQDLAMKDQLTGLYNRHFFNEVIDREAHRIERSGEVISFIMMDMDGLKHINDTLGHLTGDKVIVEGARLLRQNVRKADIVFRFGGDEFLVLLVNADCDDTHYMVKRFIDAVSDWNKENAETYGCQLSFSIGCSTCKNCEGVLRTLNEADERMYQNKKDKKKSSVVLKQAVPLN